MIAIEDLGGKAGYIGQFCRKEGAHLDMSYEGFADVTHGLPEGNY